MQSVNSYIMWTECLIDMKQTSLERQFHKRNIMPRKNKRRPLPSSPGFARVHHMFQTQILFIHLTNYIFSQMHLPILKFHNSPFKLLLNIKMIIILRTLQKILSSHFLNILMCTTIHNFVLKMLTFELKFNFSNSIDFSYYYYVYDDLFSSMRKIMPNLEIKF